MAGCSSANWIRLVRLPMELRRTVEAYPHQMIPVDGIHLLVEALSSNVRGCTSE
jgi:hypothetical protein